MAVGKNVVCFHMITHNLIILCLTSRCVNCNKEGFQYRQTKLMHVIIVRDFIELWKHTPCYTGLLIFCTVRNHTVLTLNLLAPTTVGARINP